MIDNYRLTVTCLTRGFVISVIFGTIYYSVKTSNDQYHVAYEKCISADGSWVPTTAYSAVCIRK
jgi:hypothetical protein